MMTKFRALAALAAGTGILMVASACGDDSTGPGTVQESVVGTWTLTSVNGSALPYTVEQSGANKIEVMSDVLTVGAGGAFTQLTTVRITQNGVVTTQSLPDAGTYTVSGTAVTFRFDSDGSSGTGTLNGKTLTVAAEGLSLVYAKQ